MNKLIALIIGIVVLVIGGSVVWYLASPLFVDDVVNEEFPAALPDAETLAQMPEAEKAQVEAEVLEVAAQMPDKPMDDPMPEAVSNVPTALFQGQFQDADSFHKGSGGATIYELPEGGHLLRFEEFSVTNGPDLHVLLVEEAAPANSDQIMAGYLDLGSLKGNIGNQNYEIPAGTDISKYKSVVIYCMPFHVIFATATLN